MKLTLNHIIFVFAFIWLVTYAERFLNEVRIERINVEQDERKQLHERIIKQHEEQIFIDSVIISNMPISKRDSLRAIINPR